MRVGPALLLSPKLFWIVCRLTHNLLFAPNESTQNSIRFFFVNFFVIGGDAVGKSIMANVLITFNELIAFSGSMENESFFLFIFLKPRIERIKMEMISSTSWSAFDDTGMLCNIGTFVGWILVIIPIIKRWIYAVNRESVFSLF